jgi:hypothetical protein
VGKPLLAGVSPSGSFAKGTAIKSGTDLDLFVSLKEDTTETLKEIYNRLFERIKGAGYTPRKQNVSIGLEVDGFSVDLVPARRQDAFTNDHSLYRRKADSWTKTNVQKHISYVRVGNRLVETRLVKIWRNQKGLELPSLYLEMAVIEALRFHAGATLSLRIVAVLTYLRDKLPTARFVDPANSNNIISDDLTQAERNTISVAAQRVL